MIEPRRLFALLFAGAALTAIGTRPMPVDAQVGTVTIAVNAATGRRTINPQIYGTNYGTTAQLKDLYAPLNRMGGNNTSRYNWLQNADNRGSDWYFESIAEDDPTAGGRADTFINQTKAGSALPMMTIPMLDWVGKLGANRTKLASFSIAKYGAQTGNDWEWYPDAGNGIKASNGEFVGNDPADANVAAGAEFQRAWVRHMIQRWGLASGKGVKYYVLDNEPAIWHETHRDVHPTGTRMDDLRDRMTDFAEMIKSEDPSALCVGPEEFGWAGLIFSGYDLQWGEKNGWDNLPDRSSHGDMDMLPWLLDQFRQRQQVTGKRLLDVCTTHWYPQSGEFSDDTSGNMQLLRNRSTRSLWDRNYRDESWIGTTVDSVYLIPRLKEWVAAYYPGTKIGITEYNWGAEGHMNGATAQADALGIFGREGLDMATRWTTPATGSPVYLAMKLYRNPSGANLGFGETSVTCAAPDPDTLSSFAALRAVDGALTVMAVHKRPTGTASASFSLANFPTNGKVGAFRLAGGSLTKLTVAAFSGTTYTATLPAQSVTLFVFPAKKYNAGGAAYSSVRSSYAADAGFTGGSSVAYPARDILSTLDDALYLAQREGASFSYSIPIANGQYSVRLHFAECQYTTVGQRKFNIVLNGNTVLSNFDPLADAGAANKRTVKNLQVTVTAGKINLAFNSTLAGRNAGLAAIEIFAK
jgi:hypothetical protein